MPIESGPQFLKEKYSLHTKPEVASAAKRTERRTGEKVAQDPSAQIESYLDRFAEIINRQDPEKRRHGIEALKRVLHDQFVIKPDEIPGSYWEAQRRMAREQGHGDIEITDEVRRQGAEIIIADQRSSLDTWIDYLASDDATYPNWLKYYAVRGVLGLGGYDKEKHEFAKRSKATTKPFPDLNREALAYVLDAVEKHYSKEVIDLEAFDQADKAQLKKLLEWANFGKLYAWALEKVTPAEENELLITKGRWVQFPQKTDPMIFIPAGFPKPLVPSLQGHGTGWCTAGESTAKTQLEAGDFYVFYSLDRTGQPAVPRAAIRMEQDKIAEVRGIGSEQNLDPYIAPVVQEKLKEFPDGAAYEKKAQDMKLLTEIERKTNAGQALTRDDLVFLYEIEQPIEGFGYQRDPRIDELRSQRYPEKDMPVIFDCTKDQIAHNPPEINKTTKVYVGQLEKGIFHLVQKYNLEHVYTQFPASKIRRSELTIGGKTAQELLEELTENRINITDSAQKMLENENFFTQKEFEKINLVWLRVRDLGFTQGPTSQQIYGRAAELGLGFCPNETTPNLLLNDKLSSHPGVFIAMKPIYIHNKFHSLDLIRNRNVQWPGRPCLNSHAAVTLDDSSLAWPLDEIIAFRLPNDFQET